MFDIGFLEMMVIGVLALLVLGPERLPGAIKSCIQTVRSIKEMANGFKQEVSAQIDAHELHANLKKAEEMGMQNLGKDIQDSVNELKEAAASVQRPYQKIKSDITNPESGQSDGSKPIEERSIAPPQSSVEQSQHGQSASDSPEIAFPSNEPQVTPQREFDDYQHNDDAFSADGESGSMQTEDTNADKEKASQVNASNEKPDSSFDNSLLDEALSNNLKRPTSSKSHE